MGVEVERPMGKHKEGPLDEEFLPADVLSAPITVLPSDSEISTILTGKYPAKQHCLRLRRSLIASGHILPTGCEDHGRHIHLLVPSARSALWPDCDQAQPFRQHRDFFWLSGCNLPDAAVVFDLRTTWLTLVIQPVKADDVLWSGMPMTKEQALAKYDVDEVLTMDELKSRDDIWLGPVALPDANGFLAEERGLFAKRYAFKDEKGAMLELGGRIAGTIGELRVVKDLYEIALIRKANMISEIAHVAVMKAIGGMKNEREAMALFHQQCTIHAARDQAYDSIVAGGCNAATLHYVHDDQDLAGRELLLLDAGCEVNCYASDITRTYPIRGKWTPNGRALYALVLKMQMDCMSMLRAGVVWEDVHRRAHDVAYDGLIEELKILKKGAPRQLTAAFFPHGLGHYLGLDTHDTGGNADYKDADIMFRYLRVRGSLPANCVITVEPGIYFCRFIIDDFLKDPENAKFIDQDVLRDLYPLGGVRIEDAVLITTSGYQNLTTVPKGIDEMER